MERCFLAFVATVDVETEGNHQIADVIETIDLGFVVLLADEVMKGRGLAVVDEVDVGALIEEDLAHVRMFNREMERRVAVFEG